MKFRTIILQNIPTGEVYQRFRLLLLQNIQNATAGHWNIDNDYNTITMIFDKDVSSFLDYINRQLKTYRETLVLSDGKYITVRVLD